MGSIRTREQAFAFELQGGFADRAQVRAGVVDDDQAPGAHLRQEAADFGFAEIGVGVGEKQVDGAVHGHFERAFVAQVHVGGQGVGRREALAGAGEDDGVKFAGDDFAGFCVGCLGRERLRVALEAAGDPLSADAEKAAGFDDELWFQRGDEGGEQFEDFELGAHGVEHGPLLGVGALGGGAVVLGLQLAVGAVVLQHDLVFLFQFFAEERHGVLSDCNDRWAK